MVWMKVLLEWWIKSDFENHDIRSVKEQKTMDGKHDCGINCSNLLILEEYERRRRIWILEEKNTNTWKKNKYERKVCVCNRFYYDKNHEHELVIFSWYFTWFILSIYIIIIIVIRLWILCKIKFKLNYGWT